MKIPVGLSNHHAHLNREDADVLFGEGHELTVRRPLKQLGQFACEECVDIIINGVKLEHLRLIGPLRSYSQVELIERDCETLGIKPVYSDSGKLDGTIPVTLIGPNGTIKLEKGAFIANNHVHMSEKDLASFKVENLQKVTIVLENGEKINNVSVKSDDTCVLEFHIGKDEGETLGLNNGDEVTLEKEQTLVRK